MTERMTSTEVAFLRRETPIAPQHVGSLAVLEPPAGGLDYDRLVRLLEERISLARRYRQKLRTVPGRLANPLWVDDPAFDITYHVRRSALPRPGQDAHLLDVAARVQSRLLDRSRPLWELYLLEGLAGGRVAILTKTHRAIVAGPDGVDLTALILDAAPQPRRTVPVRWVPAAEPAALTVLRDAVVETARRPSGLVDAAHEARRELTGFVTRSPVVAGGRAVVRRALPRQVSGSPLRARAGEQRRLAIARTRLADYRLVADALGGTVGDVALAAVAGALRSWLTARGNPLSDGVTVRALLSGAHDARAPHPSSADLPNVPSVDLPVCESDPARRLVRLTAARLTRAPAGGPNRRLGSVTVSHVPGPRVPLYAAGARMTETFPILPPPAGRTLSIARTEYGDALLYGIAGDRDAVRDVDRIAALIESSLAELVDVATLSARRAAAPGRRPRWDSGRTDRRR